MIGYLQGKVLDTDGKKALILTNSGVGYEINYAYFLEKEKNVGIFIHQHNTESDSTLWGFNNLVDKKMFELLKTVNKVGASKAYPLVTAIGIDALIQAILFDQPGVLSKAPGIGKKMAEQIILSLKDKIQNFQAAYLEGSASDEEVETMDKAEGISSSQTSEILSEVVMALETLGYKDKDVSSLVKKQISSGNTVSADIIKEVLREL